jgi:hypothetical protein
MRFHSVILATCLWSIGVGSAPAQQFGRLDVPSDAEATAAYRDIPAVRAAAPGKQMQDARVMSCAPAVGRPGVMCRTDIKAWPQAPGKAQTIHFARGPDSAWIADIE